MQAVPDCVVFLVGHPRPRDKDEEKNIHDDKQND